MLSKYLEGVPKEEHEKVEAEYASAFLFRKRLNELLEKQIQSEFNSMLSSSFVSENQAESIAKIKAWKKVSALLK